VRLVIGCVTGRDPNVGPNDIGNVEGAPNAIERAPIELDVDVVDDIEIGASSRQNSHHDASERYTHLSRCFHISSASPLDAAAICNIVTTIK
jgi:hypothetical protein